MASNKTLDPTTCTTASDAFKYPLPQIRLFHRSLTSELDEKNARLRTLVGGSYRQLLGTAETILHMRDDINVVEDKLGRVGKGCGRGAVSGKAGGLAKLQECGRHGKHAEELQWAARIKVLGVCAVIVGRLLKRSIPSESAPKGGRGRNLVLAAKVLVLSRLLEKSIVDMVPKRSITDKETLENLKRKLETSKRRLRRAIERTLETVGGDNREDLIQALAAHSLTTNSGAKDVLRRFLQIRGGALSLSFEEDTDKESPGYVRALELYAQTLLDVQALVPRRLSETLASLTTKHLLKDESLRELEGLRLDVCEKWFGDEILFFTPYIRHDDLEGAQAVSTLKAWAKHASEVLLQELARSLESFTEFKAVVELRRRILAIWIKEGGKARGFDPSILLDSLREVINRRFVELLKSRVSKLHLVASEIEGTLESWERGVTDRQDSLWDDEMVGMEITNGALAFKQSVLARTYGRNDAVSRTYRGYQTWRHLVEETTVAIDQLKKQRWDDDLEDIEDDATLESRNTLLSVDDPQMLQECLDSSLDKAYKDLHEKIGMLFRTYSESDQVGPISIYVLRVMRDIRSELPKNPSAQAFGLSLVSSLHKQLALTTSAELLLKFTKTFSMKRVAGRSLWEGGDGLRELPVQPSPGTFKFLHGLASSMAKIGSDLWSPGAVRVLKQYLRAEVNSAWISSLDNQVAEAKVDGIPTNGDVTSNQDKLKEAEEEAVEETPVSGSDTKSGEPENNVEIQRTNKAEVVLQFLFDVLVLQNAFETSNLSPGGELIDLIKMLESRAEVEAGWKKRLDISAREYWKRTSLLFGLIA
jgi:hypothetical protein